MTLHELKHLDRRELLEHLAKLVVRDRATTRELLECLIEIRTRKAYVPEGYASLYKYCVRVLHMSDDMAFKRIRAARVAARHPGVLAMVGDGRLHLTALVELAPYLRAANADELFAAAAFKSRRQILLLLAERFPRPDVPTSLTPVTPPIGTCAPGWADAASRDSQPVVRLASTAAVEPLASPAPECAIALAPKLAPEPVFLTTPWPRIEPLSPDGFALRVTISRATQEKLEHARALLGHSVPLGELSQVLDRALDALIEKLEKSKFAATERPRAHARVAGAAPIGSPRGRYVAAAVRREVSERDGYRCTFVSGNGHRCEERGKLEFDHIEPVARGGAAIVSNLRLRCRAHNQLAAELEFGKEFMLARQERARSAQ